MKTAKRFTLIELRASVNGVVAMQPDLKKTGWFIYTGRFTYMPFFDWECQDGAYTRMYYECRRHVGRV